MTPDQELIIQQTNRIHQLETMLSELLEDVIDGGYASDVRIENAQACIKVIP